MIRPSDDQESWNSLCARNREAFERFYRKHAARPQNLLRRCVGDSKAAEGIAQEAFLELWRHHDGFDPGRGSPAVYLFGIAAKLAADWWRHRPPKNPSQSERPVRQGDPPAFMEDAFERVDPEARALLWLREIEGYSYQELAQMLEIPLGTLKSRLFAAREQLRHI